jgi:hypothetical protein
MKEEEIHSWTFDVCCSVSVFVIEDIRRRSNIKPNNQ